MSFTKTNNAPIPMHPIQESAKSARYWRRKNQYFYDELICFFRFLVPEGKNLVEVGACTGEILHALKGRSSLAIEADKENLFLLQQTFPNLETIQAHIEDLNPSDIPTGNFDYVIGSGLLSSSKDIQKTLRCLKSLGDEHTRFITTTYNAFWEPILRLASFFKLRRPTCFHNWLSDVDLENLFFLEGFEVISKHQRILAPKFIPLISWLSNTVLVNLPFFKSLALVRFFVLKIKPSAAEQMSVSILIPARNESGNVENAILRIPQFGTSQEILFVEGNSTDDTWAEIERARLRHPEKNIVLMKQPGKGKGDAVRCGFERATGDVLLILDADLTVPPEDLPKFYEALRTGKGDFINGTRLVYPMEKQAMRFLNLLGNKFFAFMFSWLLGQKFRDTLCGTKVLKREDYQLIARERHYFGDFDPFGDFDLLFGAAKQHLKIIEIPIRYRERTYGDTNISRFRHGWLLLKMCVFAARKLKFR